MNKPNKVLACAASLLLAGFFYAGAGQATIVVDGDPAFQEAVEGCIGDMLAAGGGPADVINDLFDSKNTHTITQGAGASNLADNGNGERKPDGSAGSGCGSNTTYDPGFTLPDGTMPPSWAVLMHELTHAAQADGGTQDATPGHNKIPTDEIGACDVENQFRKWSDDTQGTSFGQRMDYGGAALPPSAIH
jgi:hypothetical protein